MNDSPDRRHLLRRTVSSGLLAGIGSVGLLRERPAMAEDGPGKGRILRVANAAMDRFDHGWRTGVWQPFLAMLTDDFSLWFPEDPARGRFEGAAGRRAVERWTAFHAAQGNRIRGERLRTSASGNRVFYEYDSVGASTGTAAYRNWELIVVTVRGRKISGFHEYWGDAHPDAGGAHGP
ncbi:hypothetical protein SMC26_19440 [Actinomadura fulvescens]|uniref:SnoaL-like domain-containing protein n=1 Tax=Actinomadura fulvescens TaxID=46160 RepID=A0ABN3QG07_9ACTN